MKSLANGIFTVGFVTAMALVYNSVNMYLSMAVLQAMVLGYYMKGLTFENLKERRSDAVFLVVWFLIIVFWLVMFWVKG